MFSHPVATAAAHDGRTPAIADALADAPARCGGRSIGWRGIESVVESGGWKWEGEVVAADERFAHAAFAPVFV